MYDGRPFRTLNVIDEGNREALRIEVGTSIPAARVVRVLDQLLEVYGRPRAIRLDNGPELTASAFTNWAEANKVKLMSIHPGKRNRNAFIELFNRSFREEVLNARLFNSISDVQQATEEWVADYNEYRPHDSLRSVPPVMFSSGYPQQRYPLLTRPLDIGGYGSKSEFLYFETPEFTPLSFIRN